MKPLLPRGGALLLLLPAALLPASVEALRSVKAEPGAVTKVVTLLTELKARIEKDGEEEQKAYDTYACWCESITAKKAKSITDLRAEITSLGNQILQLKGTVATTISEIKSLTEDIQKNEMNQQTATEVRQRENAAFTAEKVELEQAISALDSAIAVLGGGAKAASLLNRQPASLAAALVRLRTATARLPAHSKPAQKHLAALEAAERGGAAEGGRYAPQSATVQGILHDMYSSFTTNLETLTQEEGTAHKNYETMIATWQAELALLQEAVTKKEQAKAEAETMLADAAQSYADSEAQLKVDVDFFDATKASCLSKTDAWSTRKSLRAEELSGISQALTVLTSDSAKDLFAKAIKPGFATFLQEAASKKEAPLAKAREELQAHARRGGSLRLAALAASMMSGGRLGDVGHFDQVIKAIDTLLATLTTEEADDIKKVDDCNNQTQAIDLAVQDLEWKIKKNDASIQKLQDVVTANEAEKTAALTELESVEKEINESKAMRTEENGRYLQGKTDDEQAIALLKQARSFLSQYFANNSIDLGASLLQQRGADLRADNLTDYAPEAKFSGADKRKHESKGIISLLAMIIEDLEAEISQAQRGEASAQLDYEKSLAASEASAKQLREKVINLQDAIAARTSEITAEENLKKENNNELTNQEQTRTNIKPTCDFYIGHQAERREKRALEVEGLRRAKEYLAGAAQPAMVQEVPTGGLDDGSFASISFSSVSFLQRRY